MLVRTLTPPEGHPFRGNDGEERRKYDAGRVNQQKSDSVWPFCVLGTRATWQLRPMETLGVVQAATFLKMRPQEVGGVGK
jgi:hypothetical protein